MPKNNLFCLFCFIVYSLLILILFYSYYKFISLINKENTTEGLRMRTPPIDDLTNLISKPFEMAADLSEKKIIHPLKKNLNKILPSRKKVRDYKKKYNI
tara:strand:+ start:197 stop:493 length:297 start_codon:yes stop_codon:yes gene_type:complete